MNDDSATFVPQTLLKSMEDPAISVPLFSPCGLLQKQMHLEVNQGVVVESEKAVSCHTMHIFISRTLARVLIKILHI